MCQISKCDTFLYLCCESFFKCFFFVTKIGKFKTVWYIFETFLKIMGPTIYLGTYIRQEYPHFSVWHVVFWYLPYVPTPILIFLILEGALIDQHVTPLAEKVILVYLMWCTRMCFWHPPLVYVKALAWRGRCCEWGSETIMLERQATDHACCLAHLFFLKKRDYF